MFMSDDNKKKRATIIISKMKMDGSEKMEEPKKNEMGDEIDSSVGHMAAAEEILQAVESKDPKALKAALKSFVDMCRYEESESEEMEEEQED